MGNRNSTVIREVALTHAGAVFLEEARALLAHAQRATTRASHRDCRTYL